MFNVITILLHEYLQNTVSSSFGPTKDQPARMNKDLLNLKTTQIPLIVDNKHNLKSITQCKGMNCNALQMQKCIAQRTWSSIHLACNTFLLGLQQVLKLEITSFIFFLNRIQFPRILYHFF